MMKFEASEVKLYITGVNRYYRIVNILGIEEKIKLASGSALHSQDKGSSWDWLYY
jgi:hypothetical protein